MKSKTDKIMQKTQDMVLKLFKPSSNRVANQSQS